MGSITGVCANVQMCLYILPGLNSLSQLVHACFLANVHRRKALINWRLPREREREREREKTRKRRQGERGRHGRERMKTRQAWHAFLPANSRGQAFAALLLSPNQGMLCTQTNELKCTDQNMAWKNKCRKAWDFCPYLLSVEGGTSLSHVPIAQLATDRCELSTPALERSCQALKLPGAAGTGT